MSHFAQTTVQKTMMTMIYKSNVKNILKMRRVKRTTYVMW
jgi:hypothetical protein